MASLNDAERECLQRYCALLEDRLGSRLVEVRMFGSAARGDMWPPNSPMHSDIDLLIVTADDVAEDEQEALINDTYPLYLESGRQLSPHFYGEERLANPASKKTRDFLERVSPDAVVVWSAAGTRPRQGIDVEKPRQGGASP